MQHANDNNQMQEEISMPTKISDCIFLGDDIIAHVRPKITRIFNG